MQNNKNIYMCNYLFVFLLPIFTHFRLLLGGVPVYFCDLLLTFCFFSFLNKIYRNDFKINRNIFYVLLVFFIIGLISSVNSIRIGNASEEVIYAFFRSYLAVTVFGWSYSQVKNNSLELNRLVFLFFVGSSCASILGLLILYNCYDFKVLENFSPVLKNVIFLHSIGYYRLMWDAGSATAQGGMFAVAAMSGIYILMFSDFLSSKYKKVFFVFLFFNLSALFLTFSRHAWGMIIFYVVLILVIDLIYIKNKKSGLKSYLGIFFLLIFITYFVFSRIEYLLELQNNSELITRLGLYGSNLDFSGESRISSFINSFDAYSENIISVLLGAGPGNSLIARHVGGAVAGGALNAHNFISSFILNWGLFGFIFFIFIFCNILSRLLKLIKKRSALKANFCRMYLFLFLSLISFSLTFFIEHYFSSLPAMSSLLFLFLGCSFGAVSHKI